MPRPSSGERKSADSGIDGAINFFDDKSGKAKQEILQAKAVTRALTKFATWKVPSPETKPSPRPSADQEAGKRNCSSAMATRNIPRTFG